MNHRNQITIFLLAGIAVFGVIYFWPSKEPSYHGHRLSWWVGEYGNFETPHERKTEARQALAVIGTNAVPYLMSWIGNVDAKPLRTNDEANFQIKMWERAWLAAAAFSALGTNAEPYIPGLKSLVADPTNGNVCVIAEYALDHIGPDGFAAVLDVIATPGLPQRGVLMQGSEMADHIRSPNARTLAGHEDLNFRINSIRAAPVLAKCLEDHDPFVQRCAYILLCFSDPDSTVPALTNFLARSPQPEIRRLATDALAKHGQDARVAVPFLLTPKSASKRRMRLCKSPPRCCHPATFA
jgi:hypothetical protein